MPNTISGYVEAYKKLFDRLYETYSLTAVLDRKAELIQAGMPTVKIRNIETVGLGNYSRTTGYPKGQLTVSWQPYTLTQDRAREFSIDRIDDMELLGETVRDTVDTFMQEEVTPEIDAYRFAKYYTGAAKKATPTALTAETALQAIREGLRWLDDKRVPRANRYIFVSSAVQALVEDGVNRQYSNEGGISGIVNTVDMVPMIMVPQSLFVSAITLNAGASEDAGGFAKSAGASDLNFLILHKNAVAQAKVIDKMKIFSPDENQEMDAWLYQHRIYHDAFVNTRFADAIYAHAKPAG